MINKSKRDEREVMKWSWDLSSILGGEDESRGKGKG